jgi:hypothetical protein
MEEKPAEYPEATMFGILPAYGFYIRHAANITIEGAQFAAVADDARPAFYLDDVKESVLTRMQLQGGKHTKTAVRLKNSRDVILKESLIKSKDGSGFIKLENDAIVTD